ncbi:hypothetical protein [Streptomyces sp. NPDC056987]|uniref:hypothetical protein n=1 Tax=Streptomyces sp. NPDC056987 TaxID=3345988 RepID=UPI0036394C8C
MVNNTGRVAVVPADPVASAGRAWSAQMDLDTFDRIQCANVRGTFVVDQLAALWMVSHHVV